MSVRVVVDALRLWRWIPKISIQFEGVFYEHLETPGLGRGRHRTGRRFGTERKRMVTTVQ